MSKINESTMTEDTARALEIIKPLANELNIRVRADGRYLFCNGQAIGIMYNSTHATIMEFIGYLIFRWAAENAKPCRQLCQSISNGIGTQKSR